MLAAVTLQVMFPSTCLKGTHCPVMWCAPLRCQAGNDGEHKSRMRLGEMPDDCVFCKGPGAF